MLRLFCAIKVPPNDNIKEALEVFQTELADARINWVSPQNLHITLKFFGDTPTEMLDPVAEALQRTAANFPPFSFSVKGCGTFGSKKEPQVIWLGIQNADLLVELYHNLNKHLAPLGFVPDKKIFIPHLTIGRVKSISNTLSLRSLETQFSNQTFATVDARSLYLIESLLRPQGPLYKTVQEFKLGEGHRA